MQTHPVKKYERLIWPVALAVTITCASGGMGPQIPKMLLFESIDKVAHFLVFGLLATLICRASREQQLALRQGLLAIALTSLFGMSDELHQAFNPYRTFEIADWVADSTGAIVAIVVYQGWPLYRNFLENDLALPFRQTFQEKSRELNPS